MLTYLAIADRLRPRWIVWENVPGVLSSNGGRDFGTFLGSLVQLGYGFAYRVLDAQYVRVGVWPRAVPQRRRRVFVVGCLGDWAAPGEVLALAEGLQGYLRSRRAKGKGVAADAEVGAGGGCWWDGSDCAGTLTKQNANGAQRMPDKDNFGAVLQPTAGTLGTRGLRSHTELDGHGAYIPVAQPVAIQAGAIRENPASGPDGVGVRTDGVAYTIEARAEVQAVGQPVPYDLFQITAPVNRQNRAPGDPCYTLAKDNAAHAAVAFHPTQDPISNTDGSTHCMGTGSSRGDATIAVAFAENFHSISETTTAPSMTTSGYSTSQNADGLGIALDMTVRRLTPRECERLQGFPDDWTMIPYRGKSPENCPDGPRYKALGNSMACNCMAWIGERIAAFENHNP